jgi:hypothetical protein
MWLHVYQKVPLDSMFTPETKSTTNYLLHKKKVNKRELHDVAQYFFVLKRKAKTKEFEQNRTKQQRTQFSV